MIKIQFDKQALEALIGNEGLVELSTIAREKVAEEIFRKIDKADLVRMVQDAKTAALRTFNAELKTAMDAYKSDWRFPAEAKTEITKIVNARFDERDRAAAAAIEKARDKVVATIVKEGQSVVDQVDKLIEDAVKAQTDAAFATMKTDIQQLARTEFFAVLQAAKEGTQF